MPQPTTETFSEHWHRVANQHVALRSTVAVRRQYFRGEKCYVLHDPFNNQFFRITPAAYEFVGRLGMDRTIEEAWSWCLERNPDEAPGQEEVIQLLAQLYHANLLRGESLDSRTLFERYKKRRQRETRSTLLNIMFLKIPVLDPDDFLRRGLPFARWLMSPLGALIWFGVVGAAGKVAVDHFDALRELSQGILAPGNLVLLYAGLVLIKTAHEFGHAFACRRFDGEVHTIGVMLLIFTPVPYVDATASWAFRSRWQRIFVGAAGMIAELFVAALATFVWAATAPGAVHSVAYNMMFIASVSTVLFNANPLLRYDGYYILCDLLEIPNLQLRSMQMLRHLAERYAFGVKSSTSPARSRSENFWLAVCGIASWVYRLALSGAIILFVADKFLLLGVLMAAVCAVSWIVAPLGKFIAYLGASPRLERTRPRAIVVSAGGLAALLSVLWFWPAPNRFRAPGVLQAEEHSDIFTAAPGVVKEIVARSGTDVVKGQALVRMENRDLELEIAEALAEREQASAERERALDRSAAELQSLSGRLDAVEKRLRKLQQEKDALLLTAPHDGTWVSPRIDDALGQWLPRGDRLGQIVNAREFRFTAAISQADAANLFSGILRHSEVRLTGQANRVLAVRRLLILPAQQETLPSAALGWAGGGEIAVSTKDATGARAAEPFFEVRATLQPNADVMLLHGRSGKIRFTLQPEPLLQQWYRKLRQLLQRRYQI
jgi:putative peptide zinc metalloprotease protein